MAGRWNNWRWHTPCCLLFSSEMYWRCCQLLIGPWYQRAQVRIPRQYMMLNRVEEFTSWRGCSFTESSIAIEWLMLSNTFCFIEINPFGKVKNRRILFDTLHGSGACIRSAVSSMLLLLVDHYRCSAIPPAQDCKTQQLAHYRRCGAWLLPPCFVWKCFLCCSVAGRVRKNHLEAL